MAAVADKLEMFPPEERAQRLALLDSFTAFVAEKSLPALQHAREELAQTPSDPAAGRRGGLDDQSSALLGARARNVTRVLEDRARLAAESVPGLVVQQGLGVSRQRLHQLVQAGRLLAVLPRDRKASLYPAWQFAGDGTPLPDLPPLLAAAREVEMDAETLHFFMTEPSDRLGGRRPADLLAGRQGDVVMHLLRSAGLGSF